MLLYNFDELQKLEKEIQMMKVESKKGHVDLKLNRMIESMELKSEEDYKADFERNVRMSGKPFF
jgi:hypothetical protein